MEQKNSDIDTGKVDFFHDHDKKLSAEIDRFYALTMTSTENFEREALLQERDTVMDQSQEYKKAAYGLKDLLSRSVGFQAVTEQDGTSLQEATEAKMMTSMDALMYQDILENGGKGYDSLMNTRDNYTIAKENFEYNMETMTQKSNEMEINIQPGTKLEKVLSELKNTITQGKENEKSAEIER